ncbi:MAG: hypothetical protein QW520_05710 [Methanomassiliicoccales archaeon]
MDFEGFEELSLYEGRQFVCSLDGAVSLNNNVLELCEAFIPEGRKIYSILSLYDNISSNLVRRQSLRQGDVARLVLPFLKAYGLTDVRMQEHCRKKLILVPGSDKTLRFAQELMAPFLMSSSYEHHVSAVCDRVGFPFDNVYCTRVSLDYVRIDDWEAQILRNIADEISNLPLPQVPLGARSLRDLSPHDQRTISRLDEIFWKEISDLSSYQLIQEVSVLGGDEKAASLVDVCKKTGIGMEDTMYVGSDISDAQALALVKRGGGVPLAFNAEERTLREAEIAVVSHNSVVVSVLLEAFHRAGRDGVMSLLDRWTPEGIKGTGLVHEYLLKEMRKIFPHELPKVVRVGQDTLGKIIEETANKRRNISGWSAGGLI